MAAPSASMAASKLLNLRNPAIQYLIRRQLLHPAAASAASHLLQTTSTSPTLPDPQSLDLIHTQNSSINHSLNARNLGIDASTFPLYLKSATYVPRGPNDDVYGDYVDDDGDDDDDDDEDYSGSDFDDDDDDVGYDNDNDGADDDSNARPRSRGYRD